MEINFQFGEFYSDSTGGFLESLLGALIGAGAALLIFYLEGKRQKKISRLAREAELEDFFFHFRETFKSILKTLENQLLDYRTQSRRFRKAPFSYHLLPFNSSQDLLRVSEKTDLQKLYHAYMHVNGRSERNQKDFANLISLIDNAYQLHRQSWEAQKKHFEYLKSKLLEYKDLVEEQTLTQAVFFANRIRSENPDGFEQDELFVVLNRLILDYHNNEPTPLTIEYMQNGLIEPMIEALIDNFRHVPEAFYLINNCRKATWIYNEIVSKANSTSTDFTDFANNFRDLLTKLKKIKGCA